MKSWIAALLPCVVLLACVCEGEANILGPPPGSLGTIDFRYPDYIVDPIPECPSVGTFPHPNNCTWYYRCYSHYPGFYNRAYYHCEPGTIFNDALDQCTWGHWSECQNSGGTVTAAPLPCTNCINVVDPLNCDTFRVCPGLDDSPRDLQLCVDAIKSCTPCNLSEKLCGTDEYFSTQDGVCYPSPDSATMACTPIAPPPPPVTEAPTPPVPCDQCSISTTRCRPYQVCPSGAEETTMLLCPTATNQCLPCGTEEDVCPPGMFYSMMDTQCYDDPTSASMSCSVPSPPPSPPPPQGGSVIISDTSDHPIRCSYDNLIPSDEWIQKKFCTVIPLCSGGNYNGLTTLCSNYYQCILKETGEWEAMVANCPDELMYSFKENRCSPEPLPEERCANLFFQ